MAEVDPDAWEEARRDAGEHERDVLRRHLDGGLAPDEVAEARVAELDRKLGSSRTEADLVRSERMGRDIEAELAAHPGYAPAPRERKSFEQSSNSERTER